MIKGFCKQFVLVYIYKLTNIFIDEVLAIDMYDFMCGM